MSKTNHYPADESEFLASLPDAVQDPEKWIHHWETRCLNNEAIKKWAFTCNWINTAKMSTEYLLTSLRFKAITIADFQHVFTQFYEEEGSEFELRWNFMFSDADRRRHMLEGMLRPVIQDSSSQMNKFKCTDLTLDALGRNGGELFLKLLKFYIVEDPSKLTPETIVAYPHPEWAPRIEAERSRDINSNKLLIWELLQQRRDLYICEFILHTINSVDGEPRPSPYTMSEREMRKDSKMASKQFKSDLGGANARHIKEFFARSYEHDKDTKRNNLWFCYYCRAQSGDVTLLRCSKCFEKMKRPIHYCSRECQKKDWPVHKAICGKPLTKETAKLVSF